MSSTSNCSAKKSIGVSIDKSVNNHKANVEQREQTIVGRDTDSTLDDDFDQDDDDNRCWDDARDDLNFGDDGIRSGKNSSRSSMIKETKINSNKLVGDNYVDPLHVPSSSSAYSSIQSTNQSSNQYSIDADNLLLHEAVFNNDASKIYEILKNKELAKTIINKKDKHGNTALHLACMLGRSKEIISSLLQCGAAVDCKNLQRWTPFHEACSYGNRDTIVLMTKQLKDDVYDAISKSKLSENLEKTRNYRLVLKWEFQSWVPFLTRVLPSDVCVINKQGKYIRIDTKLLDFEMLSWKKGDSCLIYSDKFEKKWIIMNNKTKKYQPFETQNIDKDIEDKVDEFMSSDIMDFELKSSDIQLTRSTSGWIWKADKIEKIGKYNAALYNFNNVFLVTRKRREHLTEEDLKRNKIAYKSALHVLKFGKKPNLLDLDEASSQEYDNDDENNDSRSDNQEDVDTENEVQHRESLSPPPSTNVTWSQYSQAEPGNHPTLGREPKIKVVKTAFKAGVAMSEGFPITKNDFLDLLSIVPLKLFKKLKEFIELRLPEGFPVRIDIPVFPFLTARITFEDFMFIDGPVDESLFIIPDDYEEDQNLFPLLSRKSKNTTNNNN